MDDAEKPHGCLRVFASAAAAMFTGMVVGLILYATTGPQCEYGDPDCEWVKFAGPAEIGLLVGIFVFAFLVIITWKR
jgi:hypothetical protein